MFVKVQKVQLQVQVQPQYPEILNTAVIFSLVICKCDMCVYVCLLVNAVKVII